VSIDVCLGRNSVGFLTKWRNIVLIAVKEKNRPLLIDGRKWRKSFSFRAVFSEHFGKISEFFRAPPLRYFRFRYGCFTLNFIVPIFTHGCFGRRPAISSHPKHLNRALLDNKEIVRGKFNLLNKRHKLLMFQQAFIKDQKCG